MFDHRFDFLDWPGLLFLHELYQTGDGQSLKIVGTVDEAEQEPICRNLEMLANINDLFRRRTFLSVFVAIPFRHD